MRKRRRRHGGDHAPAAAIAFGVGLLLALFCSFRLALIVAAVTIICIGVHCRSC